MSGKRRETTDLEAELLRLNALIQERRKQLARLETCPNKDCPCRFVWREQVEKNLEGQVLKIRRQVGVGSATAARDKGRSKSRSRQGPTRRVVARKRRG